MGWREIKITGSEKCKISIKYKLFLHMRKLIYTRERQNFSLELVLIKR
jgi:hypothetical protein